MSRESGRIVSPAFTLFEIVYFCYLLSTIIRSQAIKVITWGLLGIYLFANILLYMRYGIKGLVVGQYGEEIALIIPAVGFYIENSNRPYWKAAFFIVTGIFGYFILELPIFITSIFMYRISKFAANVTFSLSNLAGMAQAILFIRAMTCMKPKAPG